MTCKPLSSLDKIKAAGTIVIADTADFNGARSPPSSLPPF